MAQLIFQKKNDQQQYEQNYLVQKRMVIVGTEVGHDVAVNADHEGIVFTLVNEQNHFEILPGKTAIKINGKTVSKKTLIDSCARIEWDGGVAVFLHLNGGHK